MPAYASPRFAARKARPATLVAVALGHAAAIAALMLAGGPIAHRFIPARTEVTSIPLPPPPPPPEAVPDEPRPLRAPSASAPDPLVVTPPTDVPTLALPAIPEPGDGTDPAGVATATGPALPIPAPPVAPSEARLDTPARFLEPPYPAAKQNAGEEARLHLSLSIDARGRVVAVEAIGPADRTFLDAARKHLLRYWRYRPATEGGVPVASVKTIWLSFTLR